MIPKVGGSIFGAKIDRKTIKKQTRNAKSTRNLKNGAQTAPKSKKGAQKHRHGAQMVPKIKKRSPKAPTWDPSGAKKGRSGGQGPPNGPEEAKICKKCRKS